MVAAVGAAFWSVWKGIEWLWRTLWDRADAECGIAASRPTAATQRKFIQASQDVGAAEVAELEKTLLPAPGLDDNPAAKRAKAAHLRDLAKEIRE